MNNEFKKLEQKVMLRLEAFSDQLNKLSQDVDDIRQMMREQALFNIEISLQCSAISSEVEWMVDVLKDQTK